MNQHPKMQLTSFDKQEIHTGMMRPKIKTKKIKKSDHWKWSNSKGGCAL